MRLATRISVIRNVQARRAMAMSWSRQSGRAAANEEHISSCTIARECVSKRNEELEFELTDYQAPVSVRSESNEASLRHSEPQLFKRWEAQRKTSASGETRMGTSTRRVWQSAPHTSYIPLQENFVITSFNILASHHAQKHQDLYRSVPRYLLDWTLRRSKILKGLEFSSPDIICLQEVDKFADIEEDLSSRGYIGLYKGRTGEMPDGCAIFWRKARFQLLQERSFEFSMLDMRHNVAQLCVLQLITPEATSGPPASRIDNQIKAHRLVVGNIHVLYNPKRGDIKLGQCRAFLEQVHNMSSIWHGAPVVIGGDFNSTPSSAVYKYLATSELELANLDRTLLSGLLSLELDSSKTKSRKILSACGETGSAIVEGTLLEEEMLENPEASSQHKFVSLEVTYDSNMGFTEMLLDSRSCSSNSSTTTEVVQDTHGWDLEELRIATGKEDCTLMRHELKLSSAYSDIQGCSNTRDANGEPLLTTCHAKFLGTVDYIWRNDGLKTMRVLDTLPVMSLAKNKGLPVKVWGSDHLPLVCELAFV